MGISRYQNTFFVCNCLFTGCGAGGRGRRYRWRDFRCLLRGLPAFCPSRAFSSPRLCRGPPICLSLLRRDAERGSGGKTLPRARGTATTGRALYPRRAPALAYPCPDAPLSRRTPVLNGSLSRRAPVLTGLCPGVLLLRRAYLPQCLLFRCASVSTCP